VFFGSVKTIAVFVLEIWCAWCFIYDSAE